MTQNGHFFRPAETICEHTSFHFKTIKHGSKWRSCIVIVSQRRLPSLHLPDRSDPTLPLYSGSADASSRLQGSGIGSMGRGGRWWGRDIKNSQYMGHESWEGKLGRVGVWEHGNGLGSGGRVRPRSPAGNVGRWELKLDFVAAQL